MCPHVDGSYHVFLVYITSSRRANVTQQVQQIY